jgi:hypothetical protein
MEQDSTEAVNTLELSNILKKLETFLETQKEFNRAGQLSEKRNLLSYDPAAALDWLSSGAIWGSSGTLWDLSFGTNTHEAGSPDHIFRSLLLELLRKLKDEGMERSWFELCERSLAGSLRNKT